jgi:exopolyphosphatase
LFHQLKDAIENAGVKGLKDWKRPDGKKLLPRRAVYEYQSDTASRKFWRPIVEEVRRFRPFMLFLS